MKTKQTEFEHGGARKNSGRHKKEPTCVIRVPKSLEKRIKQIIKDHRTLA